MQLIYHHILYSQACSILQLPFLQHQLFSNETTANNPGEGFSQVRVSMPSEQPRPLQKPVRQCVPCRGTSGKGLACTRNSAKLWNAAHCPLVAVCWTLFRTKPCRPEVAQPTGHSSNQGGKRQRPVQASRQLRSAGAKYHLELSELVGLHKNCGRGGWH